MGYMVRPVKSIDIFPFFQFFGRNNIKWGTVMANKDVHRWHCWQKVVGKKGKFLSRIITHSSKDELLPPFSAPMMERVQCTWLPTRYLTSLPPLQIWSYIRDSALVSAGRLKNQQLADQACGEGGRQLFWALVDLVSLLLQPLDPWAYRPSPKVVGKRGWLTFIEI